MIHRNMFPNRYAIFDLDDTLCHFSQGFFKWMCETNKLNIPFKYTDYNLLGPFKGLIENETDSLYWLKEFEKSGKMNDYLEESDLLFYFKKLVGRTDIQVIVMTARGWMAEAQKLTMEWLAKHNAVGPNVHLIVVPLGEDKADIFARCGVFFPGDELIAVFDDVESHLEGFKLKFPFAKRVAPKRPWNENSPLGSWQNIQYRAGVGGNG